MSLEQINIQYFLIGIIIIYIPFHLLEESLGNFPLWMYEHKWMPEKLTYGHWMANNIFLYLPLLLVGYFCFYFYGNKLLLLGIGILVWGIINCFDHIVYTIKDGKISPGLLTGLLFGITSIMGFINLYRNNQLSLLLVILSILVGMIYAFLPVLLSMKFHKIFNNIFI